MTSKKIILTGFMGSGKSTVGKLLAQKLNWHFEDSDNEIVLRHKSIPEIFAERGESGFRSIERDVILDLIAKSQNLVLATGGGSVESPELVESFLNHKWIFLNVDIKTLWDRVKKDLNRPLAKSGFEDFKNRYEKRLSHYQKAPHQICCDDLPPEDVVQKIWEEFGLSK